MLYITSSQTVLPCTDYYVDHIKTGLWELQFELSVSDPCYKLIDSETQLMETIDGRLYLVKAVNAGDETCTYKCQIDVDDWKDVVLGDWQAFRIIQQPGEIKGVNGKAVTVSVKCSTVSVALYYQWQLSVNNGDTWKTIDGYTSSSATFYINSTTDGRLYRCRVTDANGVVQYSDSSEVTLTDSEPSETITPDIDPDTTQHVEWKSGWKADGTADTQTAYTILKWITGTIGWTISGDTTKTEKRTVNLTGPTRLDIALQLADTFGCYLDFDNLNKTVKMIYPDDAVLGNGYAIRSVNLKSVEYSVKSSDYATRIYPEGKDGLTICSVNNGVPYLDAAQKWSDKVVCYYWNDNRYTIAENLMDDAQAKINELAMPERTWKCNVVDLKRIDPDSYGDLDLSLFTKLLVVDTFKEMSIVCQVGEERVYPYFPENNEITITTSIRAFNGSNALASVQRAVKGLKNAISSVNSDFMQQLLSRIDKYMG